MASLHHLRAGGAEPFLLLLLLLLLSRHLALIFFR